MKTFLGLLIFSAIVYIAIKQFSKRVKEAKGGSGGGEDTKPQDPNYPAQG